MIDEFPTFPDATRLWVFGFPEELTPPQKELVTTALEGFVARWKSHGDVVRGAFAVVYNRFVLLAGESKDGISGCSIDSSVSVFKLLREKYRLDALNRNLVFFRDGSNIKAIPRIQFGELASQGLIDSAITIFNLGIETVEDLRRGLFEQPLAQSWVRETRSGTPRS